MLPSFLQSSYKQYKTDSDLVATWLARTAQRYGYPRESLVSHTSLPHKAPKAKGKACKIAQDAAQQNSKVPNNSSKTTSTQRSSTKFLIAISDFTTLAEWIIKATDSTFVVPESFVSVLDRAIAVRKNHHDWWSRYVHKADLDQKEEANDKHRFFISVLEQVRKTLQSRISVKSKSQNPAMPADEAQGSLGSLHNLFSDLAVEQSSDAFLASAESESGSSPSADPQEEYTAGQEQDLEEVFLAVHCLINDFDKIRRFVTGVWEGYKLGVVDLVAASITTNTAIDFCKCLQDDFQEMFPQHTDFEKHINVLYRLQCLACAQNPHYRERSDDEINFNVYTRVEPMLFPTLVLLSSFKHLIRLGSTPMYKPENPGEYEASSDRTRKSARDKFREDKSVLLEILPEFCVVAKCSDTIPAEDNFTCGIREMAKTKSVPIWLVFAAQVFLDIHHVLRDQITAGFNDLVKSAQYVADSINRVLSFHENIRTKNWPRSNDQILRQILDLIATWVQSDNILTMKTMLLERSGKPFPTKPFFMLKQHPLYCGLLSYRIKTWALEGAIGFANAWGSVAFSAHLYNAVRQERLLTDVWQDMNLALLLHRAEDLFIGDFPKTCQDYFKRFCLSIGCSASNFANRRRPIPPAAFLSGTRRLNGLAPVSNKFKARICYGDECSNLLPADVEAILAEYADTSDDVSTDGTSDELVRPIIKKKVSKLPNLEATSKQTKSSKRNWTRNRSTRSVAGGAKPIEILNALLNALQSEALELTFDHFRLHTICWHLLRNVQKSVDSELRAIYGADYLGEEKDLPCIVSYILMATSELWELGAVLFPKKKHMVTSSLLMKVADCIKKMTDNGTGAIEMRMMEKHFGFKFDVEDLLSEAGATRDIS